MNAFIPKSEIEGSSGSVDTANAAVWLASKRAAFAIQPAPYTAPGEHQIVVRNRAVAINPVDWLTQSIGGFVYPWLKYPFIVGTDVAGDVVAVGPGVTRFKLGDRVLGFAVGAHKTRNTAAEGAFQRFTVLLDYAAAPMPAAMTYEDAAVLPLGVSTAASGLFQRDQLALQHPSSHPLSTGKTLLVWGGSTSVGSNAIQLAVAAGYEVVATASPKNFDYAKRLGAKQVFDYRSPTVVTDIVMALKGRTIAGALAVGQGSTDACVKIVSRCKGDRVIAMATPPVSFDDAPLGRGRLAWLIPTMAGLIGANLSLALKCRMNRVRTKFIFASGIVDNEVSRLIFADFLPSALAEGRYVAAPEASVVGEGLEQIPAAMAAQKKGVSAKKLVVVL